MYALVALGLLLCVTFPDVVFRGRTLPTSPYAGSVMGAQPPYGYRWRPPRFNLYIRDPGASAWQYEPMTAKASQRYQHGVLPLWNANQGFGAPLAANMHSSVFYPLALPLLLAPTPAMWDTYLLGRLLLAGVFTFLFLRSLEIGWVGAFGAAAGFMLCGYFMLWINESWLNVDALLPALLYGVERVVQTGARRWILFLAIAVCLAFLGGMPESTFVVVMFAAAYAGFRMAKAYGVVINTIGALPIFDRVNFWRHLGIVICLAFAVLAGIGLEVLITRRVTGRRAVVAALMATIAIAALLVFFWSTIGIRVK